MKIFISHGWKDRWLASQIARRLNELGVETFIDVFNIHKGDDIEDEIRAALAETDELLLLLTPQSYDRNWLWVESGIIWFLKKRVVGVLDNITFDIIEKEGGLTFLKNKNCVDINDLEAYFIEVQLRKEQKL